MVIPSQKLDDWTLDQLGDSRRHDYAEAAMIQLGKEPGSGYHVNWCDRDTH